METNVDNVAIVKPEEDEGTPVDLKVENIVEHKVGEEHAVRSEPIRQQHLYPDLSQQLQQFMKENELVIFCYIYIYYYIHSFKFNL